VRRSIDDSARRATRANGLTLAESLSSTESALLHVFRQQGARVGDPIPASVLRWNAFGSAAPLWGELETALLNLEFRGLIAPGPDPIAAASWALTPAGAKFLRP
jgi:hypothetical protein